MATSVAAHDVAYGEFPEALLVVRRSLRSLFPTILGLVALMTLLLSSLHQLSQWGLNFQAVSYAVVGALTLSLLELLRRYYNCCYIFEEKTLSGYLGHLSLVYRIPRVKYCDIVEIKVTQGILGRILGYGDVCVYSTARNCAFLRFSGVKKPLDLAIFIDELRDRLCQYENPDIKQCTYKVRGKTVAALRP